MNLATLDTHELENMLLAPPFSNGSALSVTEDAVLDYLPKGECERTVRVRLALAAAHELLARAAQRYIKGRSLMNSPTAVKDFLKVYCAGLEYEVFIVIYLDAHHRVIETEQLFRGTTCQTAIYPREVVRRALHFNAAALIVSHNHPSNSCDESHADKVITNALFKALELVDVKLLDHIIVAGNHTRSFAEMGLM